MVNKEKKLKILAAGDIHGDSKTSKKLADLADKENVDLVILAGDLTSHLETKNFLKPFKDKNKKVLLIPGNWEDPATVDFLADLYDMKNIHGYAVKYNDVGIFGAGGAFMDSEREVFETLKKGNDKLQGLKKKIMVTHMHAQGTKSEFSGFEGSKGIRRAVEKFKPSILIQSHIHEAEGIEDKIGKTRVINVGRRGKIIEL